MARPAKKIKPRGAAKTKKPIRKQSKSRKRAKSSAEEKIELEGIETYVYQKSFKPKPAEAS
ncbi:MAG: hypothetical protein OK452_11460 [Thaumarchaeota archaeon]|nr:hypothetical protein [Nitrososphaerota archaeon]